MKRLVRSTKTGIFCTQCEKLIPVNTSRIIDGQMHSHLNCKNKEVDMNINSENIKTVEPCEGCTSSPSECKGASDCEKLYKSVLKDHEIAILVNEVTKQVKLIFPNAPQCLREVVSKAVKSKIPEQK